MSCLISFLGGYILTLFGSIFPLIMQSIFGQYPFKLKMLTNIFVACPQTIDCKSNSVKRERLVSVIVLLSKLIRMKTKRMNTQEQPTLYE